MRVKKTNLDGRGVASAKVTAITITISGVQKQ